MNVDATCSLSQMTSSPGSTSAMRAERGGEGNRMGDTELTLLLFAGICVLEGILMLLFAGIAWKFVDIMEGGNDGTHLHDNCDRRDLNDLGF